MKEPYFTINTREERAAAMLSGLFPNGQKRAASFEPEGAALLVLDLQQYFLDPSSHAFVPSATSILPAIISLADLFAAAGRPVFFTKHINTQKNAGSLSAWWRDLITEEHPFKELMPSLDLTRGEVIQKSQYDAFFQTELEERLRAEAVRQVVISGVMTHLCCETTARAAFVRGFEVFFLVDGTATYQRDFHIATLRNLGHGFATLVTTRQVERALQESR